MHVHPHREHKSGAEVLAGGEDAQFAIKLLQNALADVQAETDSVSIHPAGAIDATELLENLIHLVLLYALPRVDHVHFKVLARIVVRCHDLD